MSRIVTTGSLIVGFSCVNLIQCGTNGPNGTNAGDDGAFPAVKEFLGFSESSSWRVSPVSRPTHLAKLHARSVPMYWLSPQRGTLYTGFACTRQRYLRLESIFPQIKYPFCFLRWE